jgi:hypothetical protein
VINGKFCYQHQPQKTLKYDHDKFYNPPVDSWPCLRIIRSEPDFKEYPVQQGMINAIGRKLYASGYELYDGGFHNRYVLIFTAELLMFNKNNYDPEVMRGLIKATSLKFGQADDYDFSEYKLHFYKTVDPDYILSKLMAKRKYIEFFFSRSDLGPLIGKYIADCYDDRTVYKKEEYNPCNTKYAPTI